MDGPVVQVGNQVIVVFRNAAKKHLVLIAVVESSVSPSFLRMVAFSVATDSGQTFRGLGH